MLEAHEDGQLWSKHLVYVLETQRRDFNVRFEVFTAVTMNYTLFLDVMPCGSCKNRRFGGKYRLHHLAEVNKGARNNVSRENIPSQCAPVASYC
jgi:hypothetical protein